MRKIVLVVGMLVAGCCAAQTAPAEVHARVVSNQVHMQARHAEGWYPGVDADRAKIIHVRIVDERHSALAHIFLGRRNRTHTETRVQFPPPPPGVEGCHADACIFADNAVSNLRTTCGADWQAAVMGSSSQPASTSFIALSNDSAAPAAGDCAAGSTTSTLASEITTNGLARASCTYAHTNGTTTWSCTHQWTATGTQAAQKAGFFNTVTPGTGYFVFESAFTQVSLVNTDTLNGTWTITY